MPQLDLLTLLDQFLISYFLFVFLHFFISTSAVPAIFEVLYVRHLLVEEACLANQVFSNVALSRDLRSEEQKVVLSKLAGSLSAQ